MPRLLRFAQRRNTLLCSAFALALGVLPAMAHIDVDNQRHYETEDKRGDFRYYSNRGNFDAAIRMGIATFEGQTFYAFVMQDGITIRVTTGSPEQGPTFDPSFACEVRVPNAGDVPGGQGKWITGNALVVDLVPRDGLLYLVCRGGPGRIYVQALKSRLDGRNLVTAGDMVTINAPVDGDRACIAAGASNGSDGLYIHGLWSAGNGQSLKLATYRVNMTDKKADLVVAKSDVPSNARGTFVNASDAASTHEFNNQGQLEEVHYFTWADNDDHLWLARFLPANGGSYTFVADSGISKMRGRDNASVLTLAEGGMNGDSSTEYSLSLIEFATSVPATGETSSATVSVLRHLSLSTSQHRYVGGWTETNFRFEDDPPDRRLSYFATAHWGIDKTCVVGLATGKKKKPALDRGPYGVDFVTTLQQRFRFSIVAFYSLKRTFRDDYNYSSFHTGEVRGNRFITDPRDPSPNAITTLDTTTALGTSDKFPLVNAWTLIGVVHGLPPYLPFRTGQRYPSLKFTYSKTATVQFAVTDSTEDSKEVTVAASLGGGDINRGDGAAKGVFSIEGSYSYGFKAVDGTTTTNTKTNTVGTTQTFEPDTLTSSYPPDQIGLLLYSAPTFVSKGYAVRRWNGNTFTDTARNVYQTVVARRELQPIYYLLDHPELGPLLGSPRVPTAAHAALTAGIPAVDRTSNFPKWRVPNLQRGVDAYDQFSADGTTANFFATDASAGSFTLNYTETDSQSKTHAETKTHKGTVKVSGGLKGIFNISVSGSTSTASTFSTTSTATTSVGEGISGDFPKLAPATGQPDEIHVQAYLLYAKGTSSPEWAPTALKDSSSPFLLTWTARVLPTRFGRKLHGNFEPEP